MSDTPTSDPAATPDPGQDGPILHKSGAVQFHLDDGTLVTLRAPKIGQLRDLKDQHRQATAAVRALAEEAQARTKALQAELDEIRAGLNTVDDDDAAKARTDAANLRFVEILAEIGQISDDAAERQWDAGAAAAADWFCTAIATVGGVTPPAADELPGWMAQLSSVRRLVEHWMTHPSPRGV